MVRNDEVLIALNLSRDEPVSDSMTQGEFSEFSQALDAAGIKASSRMHFRDATGGGAWLLGQYLVPIAEIVVPALGGVLAGWLKGRAGRKVRVKFDDTEIEANTPEDVDALLHAIMHHQQAAKSQKDAP